MRMIITLNDDNRENDNNRMIIIIGVVLSWVRLHVVTKGASVHYMNDNNWVVILLQGVFLYFSPIPIG